MGAARQRASPSGVLGPRERAPLAREESIRRWEDIWGASWSEDSARVKVSRGADVGKLLKMGRLSSRGRRERRKAGDQTVGLRQRCPAFEEQARSTQRQALEERIEPTRAPARHLGLALLAQVYENPSGLNLLTTYSYNGANSLLVVNQSVVNQSGVTRSFGYDWLQRLTSATNPESGTVQYNSYDGNGNLLSKTDARGVTVTSTYNEMNQVLTRTYATGGTTAAATNDAHYTYSDPAVANSIGRLTKIDNGSKTQVTAYDPPGRPASTSQTVGSTTYTFPAYSYNRADGLTSVKYPSGRQVASTFDAAGRAIQVQGTLGTNVTNYVSSIAYAPQGAPTGIAFGNSKFEETCFNNRLQPTVIRLGSATTNGTCTDPGTDLLNLGFTYGTASTNNGNVTAATIMARPGAHFNFSQTFGYDGLNRLKTASEANAGAYTGWNQSYVIDGVGNRAVLAGTYNGVPYWVPGGNWTPQVSDPTPATISPQFPNNRWTGATYDNAGNMTGLAGSSFVYDAENRMVSSTVGGVAAAYVYDGDGRRVQKTAGGVTTTFVYDAGGSLAAEYASGGPQAAPCAPCYLVADHLGSTRAVVDGTTAQIVELHDYLPFGEEIPAGMNGRSGLWGAAYPNQKFTGKERDGETGLDYFGARYLSSAQGRWTSPDWSDKPEPIPYADISNPQTFNLYAYGDNNPLKNRDLDGHCTVDGEKHGFWWCVGHALGINETQKEYNARAASDRQALSGMHGFTINGQTPAAIAKNGTNQQVIAAYGAASQFLLGVAQQALGPCAPGVQCGVIPIGPPGEVSIPLKSAATAARVETTLQNIAAGVQQYSRDGITFANREGLLPAEPLGYYKEYTVPPAAGAATRGAERLAVGQAGEVYYTPDHYTSFVRIK